MKKNSLCLIIFLVSIKLYGQPSAKSYFTYGMVKFNANKYWDAVEYFNRAIELDNNYAEAYRYRAKATNRWEGSWLSTNDGVYCPFYEQIISDYGKAIYLYPNYLDALIERAEFCFSLNSNDSYNINIDSLILVDCSRVIALQPNNYKAYYYRAHAKCASGDDIDAIVDFNKAIDLNPENLVWYSARGQAKFRIGDYEGCINDYKKVINLGGDSLSAAYFTCIADAKFAMNDYNGALVDYTKTIQYMPEFTDAYFGRARSKARLKNFEGAIVDFNKVIELAPNYEMAYFLRGICKIDIGEQDSGCMDLSKADKLGFPKAHDAMKRLCK